MRALLSKAPGKADSLVLEEVATPEPGPGQILVAVDACGINYPDVLVIEDLYQFRPARPFAPGGELSGTVEAVGPGVSLFKPGDRVLGGVTVGGLAEKCVMDERNCYLVPANMPGDEAAAFLMTYGTAHHALKDRARIQPGETLLVLGAAGGVGLATVELGKLMGARVIAAVSTEEKAEAARQMGAEKTILYPTGEIGKAEARAFGDAIREAAGGAVDVVVDPVGGGYAEPALRSLAWDGRFLVIGFPAGIPRIPLNLPLLKGCLIVGVFWGAFIERFPEQNRRNVDELLGIYARGDLHPLISRRYPLERGGEAIEHLASRGAIGKVIVTMGGQEGTH